MEHRRNRNHNHSRGDQHDRENVEENRQSTGHRYSHRIRRQRVDNSSIVQTALNQDDSIESTTRTNRRRRTERPERRSVVDVTDRPRGERVGSPMSRPNRLLLVQGLDHLSVNCDRMFNLFCLYGNVVAIQVLRNGKALVEMEDRAAAERCVANLHLMPLDDASGQRLKVKYSKQSLIHDQVIFKKLPDGTPVQKNYSMSILNRFSGMSSRVNRRRITNPSKIIHFYDVPFDVNGSAIKKAVTDALGVADAVCSVIILPKRLDIWGLTGLIEVKTVALAAKTVLLSNHMRLESESKGFPFQTKLYFSKWSEIQQVTEPETAVSSLRLSCVSRSPLQPHNSEGAVSVTTFQIASTTVVTGCRGDHPWTLWRVRQDEMPELTPTLSTGDDDIDRAMTPNDRVTTSGVHSRLVTTSQLRLCLRDAWGDVLLLGDQPLTARDVAAQDSSDTLVEVSGDGPLGDA